jgi:hypothetical protein
MFRLSSNRLYTDEDSCGSIVASCFVAYSVAKSLPSPGTVVDSQNRIIAFRGKAMPYRFNGCGTSYYGQRDPAQDGSLTICRIARALTLLLPKSQQFDIPARTGIRIESRFRPDFQRAERTYFARCIWLPKRGKHSRSKQICRWTAKMLLLHVERS